MSKRLSRYRTKVAVEGRDVSVTYAGTLIVCADAQTVTLNSGGWHTVTTKNKMTQAAAEFGLGFVVYARKGRWYVCRLGRAPEGHMSADTAHGAIVLPFADGMTFDRGCVVPPAAVPAAPVAARAVAARARGSVAMVAMPCQQQQARHYSPADLAARDDFAPAVEAQAVYTGDSGRFDAAVYDASIVEACDRLLRRACISPRVAELLLAFFDVPAVDFSGSRASAMVPMPVQQQQGRDTRCPVDIGPNVYDVAARLAARLRAAVSPRKPWAPPCVTPTIVPATMAHSAHWFEVWRNRRQYCDNVNDACDYSGETPDGPGYYYPGISPEGFDNFITTISLDTAGPFFFLDDIDDLETRRDFKTLTAAETAMWQRVGDIIVSTRAASIAGGEFNDDDSEGPARADSIAHNNRCEVDLDYFIETMKRAGISEGEARYLFARNAADASPALTARTPCQQQQTRHLGKAMGIMARAEAREAVMHADVAGFHAPGECHAVVARGEARRLREARRHARAVAGGDALKLADRAIGPKALHRAYERAMRNAFARAWGL